jgi:hypothetical protein
LNDPINRGKSWIQQRQSYIEKKQQIQEDIATSEAKSSVKNFVKVLNNMGLKAFKIINRELDYIDKVQADDIANNRPLSMRKQVKMSDITKIVDVLQKIAGGEGAKKILVKLELANKQAGNRSVKLQELSDEDFKQVEYQINNGGAQAIETDYEEVES